ncbi:MAG TPA: SDR family NAD(P)-dependent oxidoreductase [Gaiellaceae bacterium]
MTRDFEGKVAIVTGAAGALGRAVTGQLVERGASVVGVDLEPVSESGAVAAVEGDVSVVATAERAVSVARERFGGLDVLVCNAGEIVWKPVEQTTEVEWDRVQAVNVKGTFLFCRAAIAAMRQRGGGAIVCTASISGVVGLPLQSAYSASKGAIVQLTRQLAVELAPDIRVNAVAPGAIDTPFLHRLVESSDDPTGLTAAIAADHPLQRIASADEVARTIVFLASDAAAFVTGAILPVDGGFTAK